MKYFPKNTLAYFQSAPQATCFDLSSLPVKTVAAQTKEYRSKMGMPGFLMTVPDADAIQFYCLNHLAKVVRDSFTLNEPLPLWAHKVLVEYEHCLIAQTQRAFHYMLSIITREARHLNAPSITLKNQGLKYGASIWNFLMANRGVNESEAVSNFMKAAPEGTIGAYVGALVHVFDNGKWSSGYGGKPWGNIAKCVQSFIEGHTSAEMMVDTCYTLAHNNGPMFNKGMMYHGYTDKFIMILDIQRSGQVPELLIDTNKYGIPSDYFPATLVALTEEVRLEKPDAFGTYVDWFKVQQAGAVGNYYLQQNAQKKAHPQAVFSTFMGKKAQQVGEFGVFPGETVKVFKRVKEKATA